MRARLADPSPEDYAVAAELQRTADEEGIGLAVLFAMVLRGLGCEVSSIRRRAALVTAAPARDLD